MERNNDRAINLLIEAEADVNRTLQELATRNTTLIHEPIHDGKSKIKPLSSSSNELFDFVRVSQHLAKRHILSYSIYQVTVPWIEYAVADLGGVGPCPVHFVVFMHVFGQN